MKTLRFCGLIVLTVILETSVASAQIPQETYLNGKNYYNQGKYDLAINAFKDLADPNAKHAFREYASFYYALSAYKKGQLGLARSMWLQILDKYPNWDKIAEVNYWLAHVYFDEKNIIQATSYAKKSNLPEVRGLLRQQLADIVDPESLIFLNEQYPDDKEIAYALAKALSDRPLTSRNFILLNKLTDQFEFNKSEFGIPDIGNSKIKEAYNIAVLFPFMFDGLEDIRRISRNKFVMDLYEGIREGAAFVNQAGSSKINIWPYDTRRQKNITSEILSKEEMKSMDLIIGPLFPEPSELTKEFSLENKINMINPVSTNPKVIENNPFSFLFNPSNERQAEVTSEYASSNFENKNAIIFYNDSEQDSITSSYYKNLILEKGFDVIHHLRLNDSTIYLANELLTRTYEDTLTVEEADSIRAIKGRMVKERKPRDESGKITYQTDSIEYYEELFVISPDSIGHIFVASSDPLHAANIMSAVERRSDTIPIIGRGSWIEFGNLTTDDMERLKIIFIHPDYIDLDKSGYQEFRQEFRINNKKEPSLNNMIGYEMTVYLGTMMQKFGHYFQKGGLSTGTVDGQILFKINIGERNYNKIVPLVRFEDSKLKVINYFE